MSRLNKVEKHLISLNFNGEPISGYAETRMLLCDFIRNELGATGTHVGCEQGVCGACTVDIDGVLTRSCLALAHQANGRAVKTIEGFNHGNGRLTGLQKAFRKHHALQCGFCTPGILITLSNYLENTSKPTLDEIKDLISGHLCRCTGYVGILRAVEEVIKHKQYDDN